MGALATAVASGKALYVGISSYSPSRTRDAAAILREMGVPLLIHQPSYSMFNRWIEGGLLDALEEVGAGAITFSPLAQGVLTDRYLDGIPADSRAAQNKSLFGDHLSDENIDRVRALAAIAAERGQTMAQLAVAWTLRDPRVTSTLLGASSVKQLEDTAAAVNNLSFTDEELARIDQYAIDGDLNLWGAQSLIP
jgi:L-glyceraldehyde 3-phosphate reductase